LRSLAIWSCSDVNSLLVLITKSDRPILSRYKCWCLLEGSIFSYKWLLLESFFLRRVKGNYSVNFWLNHWFAEDSQVRWLVWYVWPWYNRLVAAISDASIRRTLTMPWNVGTFEFGQATIRINIPHVIFTVIAILAGPAHFQRVRLVELGRDEAIIIGVIQLLEGKLM
jgi:hypothetical protein